MRVRFNIYKKFLVIVGLIWLFLFMGGVYSLAYSKENGDNKIIVAYLQSGGNRLPNPDLMTHIIYAFGTFSDNNDSVVIPTPDKLKQLVELKKVNPNLKVILGIGGYKRDGFSEMASDKEKRGKFIQSCKTVLDNYRLDGIDLDWEFPTTEAGGHTASPTDDKNYVQLVKELRKKIGKKKHISIYSNNSACWIRFAEMMPYLDYVNVSGYNLRVKDGHQSNLYSSEISGDWSVDKSITRHIIKGVPPEKILLGIPFFGRGREPFPSYIEDYKIERYNSGSKLMWDDKAKVPYYANEEGGIVLGFDDSDSVQIKCQYSKDRNLGGVFYWNYDADFNEHTLAKTIKDTLLKD